MDDWSFLVEYAEGDAIAVDIEPYVVHKDLPKSEYSTFFGEILAIVPLGVVERPDKPRGRRTTGLGGFDAALSMHLPRIILMGAADQQQFIDAVKKANEGSIFFLKSNLKPAVHALNRLAMFDMLPALSAVRSIDRDNVSIVAPEVVGPEATKRINWAIWVVQGREIRDFGLPLDQVNDGREYLGCTRLDDAGVQKIIDDALSRARTEAPADPRYTSDPCCGPVAYAWVQILVKRRQQPGNSLISNLAAAAHYMLARYHVCSAKATPFQMREVVEGYDIKKRTVIMRGDPELRSMALTKNRPFPPDFAIANWAVKGTVDGDMDRLRCNSEASRPLIVPTVNNTEWGE